MKTDELLTLAEVAAMVKLPTADAARMFLNRWSQADRIYAGKQRRATRREVIDALERASRARRRQLSIVRRSA